MKQKTKNPQPLDLDILKEVMEEIFRRKLEAGISQKAFERYEEVVKISIEEIKARIKSACEFYLRYKDKPELLWDNYFLKNKEHRLKLFVFCDKLRGLREQGDVEKLINDFYLKIDNYNEWLFKLAFKRCFGKCWR